MFARPGLDAVSAPAHQGRAYADARLAFSGHQSGSRPVGSAGHPVVCARLYRGSRPRLAAHSPHRLERPVLGAAPSRPSADSIDDLLVYCAFGVIVGGRLGNVLFYDPGYYFSHPLDIFKIWEGGMAFHGGLIGAFARHRPLRPPLSRADAHGSRSLLAGRPDRALFRPHRQFHPARAMGSADRRPLGGGLSGNGRIAAASEPDLRSASRRAVLSFVILFALARGGALKRPGLHRRRFRRSLWRGAHFLRVLPRARSAARGSRPRPDDGDGAVRAAHRPGAWPARVEPRPAGKLK